MSTSAATDAPSGFRAPPRWVVWVFLLLGIAAVVAAFFIPLPKRPQPADPTPAVSEPHTPYAPVFVLTERSGKSVSNNDLDGKVWVASFVFTRCIKGCPQVTATMARLKAELKLADHDDLRLVTFTVDPERDKLEDLNVYAKNFGAEGESRWLFLTGPEEFVRLLLNRGFRIAALKRDKPEPGDEFDHSTKLLVVDKRGRIRGAFDGMIGDHDEGGKGYAEAQKALKALVGELLRE